MTTWNATEQIELEQGGRLDICHDGDAGDPVVEWGADPASPEVAAWKAGDTFGWMLLDDDGDIIDSCWSYYGGPDSSTWDYMIKCGRDAWTLELGKRAERAGAAPADDLEAQLLGIVRERDEGDEGDSDGEIAGELRDAVDDFIGRDAATASVARLIEYRQLVGRLRNKISGKV